MFRPTHRPSSGDYNCTSSLWFAYLEGCWTCGCWTLSEAVSAVLAPDDGRFVGRNIEFYINI